MNHIHVSNVWSLFKDNLLADWTVGGKNEAAVAARLVHRTEELVDDFHGRTLGFIHFMAEKSNDENLRSQVVQDGANAYLLVRVDEAFCALLCSRNDNDVDHTLDDEFAKALTSAITASPSEASLATLVEQYKDEMNDKHLNAAWNRHAYFARRDRDSKRCDAKKLFDELIRLTSRLVYELPGSELAGTLWASATVVTLETEHGAKFEIPTSLLLASQNKAVSRAVTFSAQDVANLM